MGLRGPNAKPVAKKKRLAKPRQYREPWRKAGLSRADRVIRFIEHLKITSGMHAGRKFKPRTWQRKIIRAIYRVENRRRVVRQALVCLPRKQGKSTLAAALALVHLIGPEAESRGQVFSAAADRGQASILYREMVAMILANPGLAERVAIRDFNKTIEDIETGSIYSALSADARKAHGLSPSFVVMDELAQWPGRDLYDALISGGGARREPLFVTISTKSPDENSVMSELVRYGEQVLAGDVDDPSFHATIYAAAVDADPWTEATWRACNPAYGDFRSAEEFKVAADQAKRVPARQPAFELLYLNRAIDAQSKFLQRSDWEACRGEIDPAALKGERCFLGLDLSATIDLTGLAAFFPDTGDLLTWGWLPADGLAEAEDRDHAPYQLWARQGVLETTPGRSIDRSFVVHRIGEIVSDYDVVCCFADRWRLDEIERLLVDEGIRLKLEPHGMGWKDMAPSIDAFESAVLAKKLRHSGHPPLNMCVMSATVLTDPAGNRKLVKNRSYARIDLLVAAVMAIGGAARTPPTRPSIYEERGVISLGPP